MLKIQHNDIGSGHNGLFRIEGDIGFVPGHHRHDATA